MLFYSIYIQLLEQVIIGIYSVRPLLSCKSILSRNGLGFSQVLFTWKGHLMSIESCLNWNMSEGIGMRYISMWCIVYLDAYHAISSSYFEGYMMWQGFSAMLFWNKELGHLTGDFFWLKNIYSRCLRYFLFNCWEVFGCCDLYSSIRGCFILWSKHIA